MLEVDVAKLHRLDVGLALVVLPIDVAGARIGQNQKLQGLTGEAVILLQALPKKLAWSLEWVGDAIGLACCLFLAFYGTKAAWATPNDKPAEDYAKK